MQPQGSGGREIDSRSSLGHLGVVEQRAAADFEIGHDAAPRSHQPLERKRIYAEAVSRIRFLHNQESRHGFHSIFHSAAEDAAAVRPRENETVTQAEIPNTIAGLAAVHSVTTTGPDLNFVATFDRSSLGAR